ncbi:hypothetical protein CBM2613_B50135 [Cupriavidus taiwanensis]|uniref:Uncharacterized protein n=1 Tax=Cupriavidus taiwanensis TaxID=164546 RepID=A0A375EAC0_9BURK|nr:hypothetical protein CBM2613_B50135 [Cupriavidus taiwanensis]
MVRAGLRLGRRSFAGLPRHRPPIGGMSRRVAQPFSLCYRSPDHARHGRRRRVNFANVRVLPPLTITSLVAQGKYTSGCFSMALITTWCEICLRKATLT